MLLAQRRDQLARRLRIPFPVLFPSLQLFFAFSLLLTVVAQEDGEGQNKKYIAGMTGRSKYYKELESSDLPKKLLGRSDEDVVLSVYADGCQPCADVHHAQEVVAEKITKKMESSSKEKKASKFRGNFKFFRIDQWREGPPEKMVRPLPEQMREDIEAGDNFLPRMFLIKRLPASTECAGLSDQKDACLAAGCNYLDKGKGDGEASTSFCVVPKSQRATRIPHENIGWPDQKKKAKSWKKLHSWLLDNCSTCGEERTMKNEEL